jgi:aminoglycoside phosphotransferase (APT) family kinase protein
LSETRKIAAVIDWEYAGVGDPLYDVAWILAPHFMSAAGGVSGLMSEAQFLARYRRFSGIDFRSADVAYWRIFQQLRIHAMFADSVHRTARADAEHARYRRLEAALPRQRKDLRMLVEGFSRFSS